VQLLWATPKEGYQVYQPKGHNDEVWVFFWNPSTRNWNGIHAYYDHGVPADQEAQGRLGGQGGGPGKPGNSATGSSVGSDGSGG
jgi:hypothetical protein